jgi:2-methylisocitrate lyase-like PEP mutase family enzyme
VTSPTPRATGDTLRSVLDAGQPVVLPGVWDALSMRLAADAGFGAVFVSGFCVSATRLGLPDFGYLTQAEMADVAAHTTVAAPQVAAIVDADTGYGNPLNARRTVQMWEASGAAGLFLEDQAWPKKCGHMAGKVVVPVDDWLSKLRAAVDARTHLHITARTDARAAVSLDDAIERVKRAADVGVDALFVEAPQSVDEMAAISAALTPLGLPLVANMIEKGRTPMLSPDELHDLGFDLIVSPLSLLFAATKAMQTMAAVLASAGTTRDHLDELVAFDSFTGLVDLDAHYALETRFTP